MKKQNICIIGLWHLGTVTSACFADIGHKVTGFDQNKEIIKKLKNGIIPVSEPNLENLIKKNLKKNLFFTSNVDDALKDSNFIFICIDTPLDQNDVVDVSIIYEIINQIIPFIKQNSTLIIQSQIPVGNSNKIFEFIKKTRPKLNFSISYIPENLRLGNAIENFTNPERIVIGVDDDKTFKNVNSLFSFTDCPKLKMKIKSAEMTKHAINSFLATCISYINWIGELCSRLDIDVSDISQGLMSEKRIGKLLPLKAGLGFSGGTLGRDLQILKSLADEEFLEPDLIETILDINNKQNSKIIDSLQKFYPDMSGKKIAVLGLVYKPGTNTLRRSISLDIINKLLNKDVIISAYDPAINSLSEINNKNFQLVKSPYDAAKNSDALLILTEWEEFQKIDYKKISQQMNKKIIFDFKNFLKQQINPKDYEYVMRGTSIKKNITSYEKTLKILENKISIVTGGGSGLGKSIALEFAKEGSHVILMGRTKETLETTQNEIQALGGSASIITLDVSDLTEVSMSIKEIISKNKKIDVIVNAAGTNLPIGPLHKLDLDEWEKCLDVNLMGTVNLIHEVLPYMIECNFGRIINFSGGGAFKPFPNFSAYSVSKSAVVRLTETIASEVKNYNITVNAISPGAFDTKLMRNVLDKGEIAGSELKNAKKIVQFGGGDIEKVTELSVFLASDNCSILTGKTIAAQWDDLNKIKQYQKELSESEKFTMRRV